MNRTKSFSIPKLAPLLMLGLLTSCDKNSDKINFQPVPVANISTTVVPSLGLIRNASVQLTDISGNNIGEAALTDTSGSATISTPETASGPFIVVVTGASNADYYDEAAKAFVAFGASSSIRAILPTLKATVGVSPLTEVAAARFIASGGATADDVNAINEAVRQAFLPGIADITTPASLVSNDSSPLGKSEADLYAAYLATLANLASAVAAPALAVTKQLAEDFKDGQFDSSINGTAIVDRLFDNKGANFNAALNIAVQKTLANYGSSELLLEDFNSTIAGFTPVTPTDDAGSGDGGDTGSGDGTGDGTTGGGTDGGSGGGTDTGALSEAATAVAAFAGNYQLTVIQAGGSADGTNIFSDITPGETIDLTVSDRGLITVKLASDYVFDTNFTDTQLQSSPARETATGQVFVRRTIDGVSDFINFIISNRGFQGVTVSRNSAASTGNFNAIVPITSDASALLTDLDNLGSQNLTQITRGANVPFTPYLCDENQITFTKPTVISSRILGNGTTQKSLPLLKITASIASQGREESLFNDFSYQFTANDDGSRSLSLGRRVFILTANNVLHLDVNNADASATSRYSNDSSAISALNCPPLTAIVSTVTGLSELGKDDQAKRNIRLDTRINATGVDTGSFFYQIGFFVDQPTVPDVTSITQRVPQGFTYEISKSRGAAADFCQLSNNASGTVGTSQIDIALTCSATLPTSSMICFSGSPTPVTTFPTRTAGDSDGNLKLTTEQAGSPVALDTVKRFTFSSSGALFIDNTEISASPYICGTNRNEFYWTGATDDFAYSLSLLTDGKFNEVNLLRASTFLGQFTDEESDLSNTVFDLSTLKVEGE